MKRLALLLVVVCSLAMLFAAIPAIAQPVDETVTGNLTVAGNADVGGHVGVGGYEETQYLLTQIFSSGATKSNLGLFDTRAMAKDVGGQLMFGGKYTTAGAYQRFAMIAGTKETDDSGNYDGVLKFFVRKGSFVEAMTLSSAGSLDVAGAGIFGGTGASAESASIVVGAANGDYGMIGYNTLPSPTSAGQYLAARDDDWSSQISFFQGGLKFRTTIDTKQTGQTITFRESMNIQRNGDVGIGVATPTASLQTHGAAVFGGTGGSSGMHSLVVGAANGDYGIVGYNTMPSTSAGQYYAARADYASQIHFLHGMLKFRTAASHAANQTISFVEAMTIDRAGQVGIGTGTPAALLDVAGHAHVSGNLVVDGAVTSKFQDIAEWVPSTEAIEAGTVVIVAPLNHVSASREAYDTRVAGVVSAQPGLILGEEGDSKVLVATTGRVKVRVDASNGAIREGDILVSSGIKGTAMKSEPVLLNGRKFHQPGTVIGKALEPLEKGSGEILVLLSMQ